ncbi:MAG: hypothetical protein SPL49_00600 [Oribacterium sp.]|nr:hypothetical protein [Oribacterium sp.]
MDELFEKVVSAYNRLDSIKDVAATFGISTVKVRRILITLGLWSSSTSRKIGVLYDQGLSVKDIATRLYMSEKNVQAYIPYSKGAYGKETYDAQMSRDYRERQQVAVENMRALKDSIDTERAVDYDWERGNEMSYFETEKLSGSKSDYAPKVMKLRLSLEMQDMDEEEKNILHEYGDAKEGITRTVLIPASMPLHALHYLINQAFGWQNSHLHNFRLPEAIEQALTDDGSLSEWSRLCGVYFRFPSEYDDIFWDDDYIEGESPKTWIRRKYNGPYYDGAKSEEYENCQKEVKDLRSHFSSFEVREDFGEMYDRHQKTGEKDGPRSKGRKKFDDATIHELETAVSFDHGFYELLEHIKLYEILMPGSGSEDTAGQAKDDRTEALEGTVRCNGSYNGDFCRMLAERLAMPVPVTEWLEYEYDYGDDWKVSIECVDEYVEKESADGTSHYFDRHGIQVLDDELFMKVGKKLKPVCIESDGLPVLDDAGGIHGYIETLRTIKGQVDPEDPEAFKEQKETKSWARMQGWTGKKVKPENIL